MVRPLTLAFLGLSLVVGCTVGDTGDGSGGHPDANNGGADSAGEDAPPATPKVAAAVDKSAVSSELGKNEAVTLTLTSQGGFTGPVTIAATLSDAQGQTLPALTVQGPTSVTLAAGQSVPSTFMITIPTNASGGDFTGMLKLAVSSTTGSETVTSTLSVAAVYTFETASGTGTNAMNHPANGKTFSVKRGARIAFHNADTIEHITHGDTAFPHESTVDPMSGLPGGTYTVQTTNIPPGSIGNIGCHNHGSDATYAHITIE